jgi:hypothetical protein
MSYTRATVGQSIPLTQTLYSDGDPTDLGTVTIGIVDANGDTIVAPGTAVTDNSDGTYEYTLAKQTELGFLIATWKVTSGSDFVSYIEVVGNELYNEAQMRAFGDGAITASDYSDTDVARARDAATDYLEQQTGRSWITRYARVVLPGSGGPSVWLENGYSVTSSGVLLDRPGRNRDVTRVIAVNGSAPSNVTVTPHGELLKTEGHWEASSQSDPLNVAIQYVYGLPYSLDGVDRIAMMLARHFLVASRQPANAVSYNDALGTYQFDQTRIPREVWDWIRAHRAHAPFG